MSVYKEILEALPKDKKSAISARDLFAKCKGAADIKHVSSLLSQMYASGTISRKEVNLGQTKYIYWNEKSDKVQPSATQENNQVDAPATSHPAEVSSIKSMVETVINSPAPEASIPTIKIDAQIQIPDVPNTLQVIGIKPASLDYAIACGGAVTIDVGSLDEAAVNNIIEQWGQKFKQNVQSRRGAY